MAIAKFELWDKCYSLAYSEITRNDDSLFSIHVFPKVLTKAAIMVGQSIKQNETLTEDQKREALSHACEGFCNQIVNNHFKEGEGLADSSILLGELLMLRRAFSHGGPFEGVKIVMPSAAHPNILRMMSVIHLSIKEPHTFEVSGGVQKFLASLDILRKWKAEEACQIHMEMRKYEPAVSIDEVLSEVRHNIHKYIGESQLPRLQSRGGLEWLKVNDANVCAIMDMCGDAILKLPAGSDLEPFSRLSRLTLDCLGYLDAKAELSEKFKKIRFNLLKRVLVCDGIGDNSPDYEWTQYIRESYRSGDENDLDVYSLVTLIENIPTEMLDVGAIKSLAVGREDDLKSAIQDICTDKFRHKVVHTLGIEHLYTRNELLLMQGHQFSGDLGL